MPRSPDNQKAKVKVYCRIDPELKEWGLQNGVNFSRSLEQKLREDKIKMGSYLSLPINSTYKWLSKHDCTIAGYWGDDSSLPDLLEVLNVYVDAILDGESGREAIENEYPEIYEDIEIANISGESGLFNTPEFKRLKDCKHKIVFLKDEVITLEET